MELINLATFLKFRNLPLSVDEAKAGGWTKIDSCKGMKDLESIYFVKNFIRNRGVYLRAGVGGGGVLLHLHICRTISHELMKNIIDIIITDKI